MRDLVRQIIAGYSSTRLQGQDEGIIVFSGQEPDTKQAVWIKILPRLLGEDSKTTARFRSLAQALRQLNHPNIGSVRAVGEKGGLPYIVNRAIEKAQPLAAKLNQPWAVDEAADVVMQTGQALAHAYNKGVVHGSLSPQNIVVQENGQVKVTDLGLSQLLDLLGVQVRQAVSPYMAPERATGQQSSARADVYSLAAILYSLLVERPPQVVKGQVLPPGRFNPDVPSALNQVVVKALAPNPADRYPDAKSFLAALGAVVLHPDTARAEAVNSSGHCPKCGTGNQTGRFCRKCGAQLPPPPTVPPPPAVQPSEGKPIQGTQMASLFPEPLPMPQIDLDNLWATLATQTKIAMPVPPPMPVIDWEQVVLTMPRMPATEEPGSPAQASIP